MATDLETRPDEDQENSRIQQHYDQKLGRGSELDDIADQEQQAATDSGSDATGESGGLYRNEGSGGSASDTEKTLSPNDPVNPGNGGLYSGDEDGKRGRRSRFLGFNISRRKGVTGGIIGLMLGGGMFFGFGIASGPLQAIHLSEVLHHSFNKSESDSSNRTRHLFRYARAAKTGNIGETRVSVLGSKVFGNTLGQLKEIGIEINTDPRTGQPTRTRISTDKLQQSYPELAEMNNTEKKAFLSEKLGVKPESITGKGSNFSINQTDMNMRSSRLLSKGTVGLLDDGKIVGAIKTRILTRVFDLPSLFHPLRRAEAATAKKLLGSKPVSEAEQAKQAEEKAQQATATTAAGDAGLSAKERVAGKVKGITSSLAKGATVQGVVCIFRGVSDAVIEIDRARVVLPAAAASTRMMGLGAQTATGQDLASSQVGGAVSTFTDKKGTTIWQNKALASLAGEKTDGLSDLDDSERSAFASAKVAAAIQKLSTDLLGNEQSADFLCSAPVLITETGVVIAGSALAEYLSGGLATPALAGLFAANQAKTALVGFYGTKLATDFVLDKTTKDALAKDAFEGERGGGLYAYGIRAASNTAAISTGGIALSNDESTIFAAQQAAKDKKAFASKSMFARMFDANDYHSLAGRLADSISPNAGQNMTRLATSISHMGSTLGNIFNTLTPHAAAAQKPYDWGFPQYGIPQKLLDDPRLADPYANADAVAQRLDTDCKNTDGTIRTDCEPISKAHACFGVNINLGSDSAWDVTLDDSISGGIDPEAPTYPSDCGNTSDLSWDRIIMFVFDTNTMKAAACYQGDEPSCTDLGQAMASPNTAQAGTGGQLRIATFNVLGAGHTGGNFEARADKSVATIASNNIDVVGTQELRPKQRNYFVSKLTSYDNFPKGNDNSDHGIENSIFWNKTKFEYVDGGFEPGVVYFCGNGLDAPWVKLRSKSTGQEFYVINTHDPSNSSSNPCSDEAAQGRYENAKAHVAFLKKLQANGLPMFFTGDFNSAYIKRSGNGSAYQDNNDNLTYCVMSSSGIVRDAYDLYRNRPFKCPNPVTNNEDRQKMEDVDHVYMSSGMSVTNWTTVSKAKAGSDHIVEIFDVTMPGSGGAAGSDLVKSLGIKKVLVVVEENHSLDQMKQGMPYTFSLAKQYGYTTNYTAITHPSLPNYIAMAAGSTMGVTDDKEPSEHKLQGQTVFGQAISSGKTAKIYAESMGGNCDTTSGGKYLARHNPWAYFVDERSLCKQYDVPATQFQADVTAGTLPNVGMLIPNRCNDAHDCSLATADNWFKGQMKTIMNGPDWKLGNLLVVLTADEDDKKSNNTVLTVLLNPNVSSAVTDSALSHYSLSQLLSGVSGNTGLRNAKSASPITLPSNTIQKVASP